MPKSLEEGFAHLISAIKPLDTEHDKAAKHKSSAFGSLVNNWGCTSLLETGSFGNKTGVRHYSDTDYFAVCPAANLPGDSGTALCRIKETLQVTFPRTKIIEVKTPSVRLEFGKLASERMELTPACFKGLVDTPVGKKSNYRIPDFDGGWMDSSPQAHNAYVNRENKRLKGKLKPLIQLVKAWKFFNDAPILSFYLELRITKYAEGKTAIVYDTDIRNVLKLLYDNGLASIRDPMGISGLVSACKTEAKRREAFSKISTAYGRAIKACDCKDTNIAKCFEWWQKLYNGGFPAR